MKLGIELSGNRFSGWSRLIDAMETAFVDYSNALYSVPERVRWSLRSDTELLIMCASSSVSDLSSIKTYFGGSQNGRGENPVGELLLFRTSSGERIARFDAAHITNLRTAACAAAAVRRLSAPSANVLAVMGAGTLCTAMVDAISTVRPIKTVVVSGRDPARLAAKLGDLLRAGHNATSLRSPSDLRHADIICTVTSSREPLFKPENLRDNVHVCAIGGHTPDMIELPRELVRSAALYADSAECCAREAGDLLNAFTSREEVLERITEIGTLSQTARPPLGVSIYKSVGNAAQDLAAAAHLAGIGCPSDAAGAFAILPAVPSTP